MVGFSSSRLAEVGVLETPKRQGTYDTGQVCKQFDFLSPCKMYPCIYNQFVNPF